MEPTTIRCPEMQAHIDTCEHDHCAVCLAWCDGADDYEQATYAALDRMLEDLREVAAGIKQLRRAYEPMLAEGDIRLLSHAYAYIMTVHHENGPYRHED